MAADALGHRLPGRLEPLGRLRPEHRGGADACMQLCIEQEVRGGNAPTGGNRLDLERVVVEAGVRERAAALLSVGEAVERSPSGSRTETACAATAPSTISATALPSATHAVNAN